MQNVIRMLLFVVFFGIGAAALGGAVLYNDLVGYYQNSQLLKRAQESLDRLGALNADYEALLDQLEKDPNLIKRLGPATLGTEHEDANAVYPKVTPEQLAAARKALSEDLDQQPAGPVIPEWLSRCSEPRWRLVLFCCGAALILLSFVCFSPAKLKDKEEK